MKNILRFLLVFAAMFCMTCFTAFAEDTDDPDTYYLELDAAGGQLSGETSTVISSPSAEFTTVDLSKYKPEKDGFTFTGWYNDKTKVTSIDTSYFQSTNRIKLTAMYTKDSFSGSGLTFTLNANGGKLGDADSGTYDFDVAGSGYGVALNDYPPTREGYEFKGWNTKSDGSGKTVNIIYTSSFEKAADNGYEYSDTDDSSAKRNLVFYAMWKSDSAPTGTISMGDKSWNGLQDVSSFEQYYNNTQKVTITCDNNSDPSITVGYLISDSALSSDDLGAATFTKYKKAISIKDEGKYVVYAKLSSEDGKTTYLSTDGFIIDTTREGYEFKGWNTKSDGSGKTVNIIYTSSFEKAADNGYEYSDTDDSSAKRNLVFYAMWKSDSAPTGTISMGDKSWNGLQDVSSFEQYYNNTQKVTITCDNNSDPSITVGYLISDSALSSDDLGAATFTKYKKAISIKDEGKYVVYAKLSSEDGKTTYLSTDGFIIDTHAPKVTGIADGETYCLSAVMTVKESHLAKVTVNGEEKSFDDDHSLALEATDGEQTIIVSDKAGNETKLTVTVNKKHTAETDDGDCTTPQKCRYCGEIVVEGKSSHNLGNWTSDGNGKTHSRKCKNKGCGYKVIQDCSGGTATCQKKAVCSVCGKSYGKLSTTNHTDLKKTDYVAATTSSKGNIEYWYCSACKKYFSNKGCTKEISKADTVIDKAAPEIIGGKGSKWSKASKNTIKFRSNAEYADFVCVLIDDKELDPSYYNKKEGSIIIELKTSYLESLSVGSHTITIRSKTGDAVTTFTVSKKKTSTTTQTTTRATTEATTASTTEVTTEYRNTFTPVTTEATTTEISTIERTTTETTTEVTTEKSTLTVGSYASTDKSKSKVHNLQLIILITVLATILISFVIIIISGMKKK